ncbi:MAG: alpha/beta fold hydrolase [Acidobacteriota bacterium]|nr:alpha/beta fold hydrolase [Acidobacteriota bacterium]
MMIQPSSEQGTASRRVTVDGIELNYRLDGPGGDGPTLLMIHGFGASLRSWDDICPFLASGCSIIRLDLKGSGLSAKPHDGRYRAADQATLIEHFLAQLGVTDVVLVGHSLGGAIALLICFDAIERALPFRVSGLILIDSAGYPQRLPFFVRAVRFPPTRLAFDLLPARFSVWFVLSRIFSVKSRVTSARVQMYAHDLDLPGGRAALRDVAESLSQNDGRQLASRLPAVRVPTLLIWGRNDPVIPLAHGERFNHDLASSELVILDDTGHVPHEERPAAVASHLSSFVRRLV